MLYIIDGKCYINIGPSIYVEVAISNDGNITPTKNKIEVSSSKYIRTTTLKEWLKEYVETEPSHENFEIGRKYNKRKK